jgi:hypothetical protein
MLFVAHGDHVELLGRGDRLGDQDLEGVAVVVGGEQGGRRRARR